MVKQEWRWIRKGMGLLGNREGDLEGSLREVTVRGWKGWEDYLKHRRAPGEWG